MSDKTIDLATLRGKGPLQRPDDPELAGERNAEEQECHAFGYLRGVRDRAACIEFRFAAGHSVAFPYHWLGPIQYQPSAGILLQFNGDRVHLVLLEGANLNALVSNSVSLYERGILRHRVTWVREMTRQELQKAAEGEVTVERIHTLSHRPDEQPTDPEWLMPFRNRI